MTITLEFAQSLTAGAAVGATLWLLAGIVIVSRRLSFYSQLRQTISELGAHGTRHARVVAWLVFFPVGLLVLLFSFAFFFASGTSPTVAEAMWLFALVGVAYIGSAFFPCDVAAPMFGSWRNNIHMAFGIAEYLGALAGLYLLQGWFVLHDKTLDAFIMQACLFAIVAGVLLMTQAWLMNWRGLAQRIAEAGIFGAMLWVGTRTLLA
jgi:hypothetical protein